MFARFRLDATSEVNVNVSLVRDFEPGTVEGTTKINFLGGDSRIVPVSNRAVRHSFKTAMAEHQRNYPEPPATPATAPPAQDKPAEG